MSVRPSFNAINGENSTAINNANSIDIKATPSKW